MEKLSEDWGTKLGRLVPAINEHPTDPSISAIVANISHSPMHCRDVHNNHAALRDWPPTPSQLMNAHSVQSR
jgi:hypothetical protein